MSILVVSDIQEGQLRPVNAEIFSAAVALAETGGLDAIALFIGSGGGDVFAKVAARYGIRRAVYVEDESLRAYSPDLYASIASSCINTLGVTHVLMAATFTGKDLMPRIAQHLDAGLVQDVTSMRIEASGAVFTRPMYAGKVYADVRVASMPALATIRPRIFKALEKPVDVVIERLDVELPAPKVQVVAYETVGGDRPDVTEADIIVSGGRGMQGADQWGILEALADQLGAATGCSRPVSDDGWRPHEEHIGQTGKTVSPNLYIACGISGAIQHVAGMSSSKYIVAVNKDPEAPIFKVADYGIVGDVFDVLPAMTEAIKALKET